ncbi:MAG: tyrosine-type recombinase/integrase [bacterium]
MNLDECIEKFSAHLRRNNYSIKTIDAYLFDLSKFRDFVILKDTVNDYSVNSINSSIIKDWLDFNFNKGISSRSVARKVATLSSFFKFLFFENIVSQNPCDRIRPPKVIKKIPSSLSQDEVRQLINAVPSVSKNYLRDRSILILLYSTGIRVSELTSLKIHNFSLDNRTIHVTGKGGKERIIPLTYVAYNSLLDYLSEMEKNRKSASISRVSLFTRHFLLDQRSLTPRIVYYVVQKYSLLSGINIRVHPHLLRHSIATHLVENGCHIDAVQKTLGHENLSTTTIYLKTSSRFLRSEHKKHNPTDSLLK